MEPITYQNTSYYLLNEEKASQKVLCVEGDISGFEGVYQDGVYCCPLSPENAAALRKRLPWLKPRPLSLSTSFGFGDRLGLATPGHLRAVRGTGIAPIFAQQSVRENQRTGRTPQNVVDDVIWVLFENDWREPWGADADHIKEITDLQPFFEADYTFYTIDPNLHVDNDAPTDSLEVLENKLERIPWVDLQSSLAEDRERYLEKTITLGDLKIKFSEDELLRALVKYGPAIAHIKTLSDFIIRNVDSFDLEASVDETDTPTTVKEHYYIANELRRLKVPFVSLAPRFIGSFEKGVDYIGDLAAFEKELAGHTAVMHALGGYKLSIHTGSDKFSIYPMIAQKAKNLVHVKTAGTSYLEALRVIAVADTPFFREIFNFAYERYEIDRTAYRVSGSLNKVTPSDGLSDKELMSLFDQFDARQVLHVTFGSVLDEFGKTIDEVLKSNTGKYEDYLTIHFERHLESFVKQ